MPLTEQEKENVRATYNEDEIDNGAYDAYGPNVSNEMLVDEPQFIDETPVGETYWDDDTTGEFHEYMNYVDEDTGNDRRFWGPEQVERYVNYRASQGEDFVDNGMIDYASVDEMHNILANAPQNQGKPYEEWTHTPESSTLASQTKTPPVEAVPEWEQHKATWSATDESMKQKGFQVVDAATVNETVKQQYLQDQPATTLGTNKFYVPADISPVTGQKALQTGEYQPSEVSTDSDLLPFQKIVKDIFNGLPAGMAIIAGGTTAARMTAAGHPVAGLLVGTAQGLAMAGGNEMNADGTPKYPVLYNGMIVLNYLADKAEQIQGIGAQVIAAPFSSEGLAGLQKEGWTATKEAARVAYESGLSIYDKDNNLVSRNLQSPDLIKTPYDHTMSGIPLSDQQAEAMMLNPSLQAASSLIGFNVEKPTYEKGYKLVPFDTNLMVSARKRIAAGENPDDVVADITAQKGFGAQAQQLVGNIALDPLDILPKAVTKATGKAAELTGHTTLAKAADIANAPIEMTREYGSIVRSELDAGQRANLNPIAKWAYRLDKVGNITDIQAPGAKQNPFDYLLGLDRKSRATQVLNNSLDGIRLAIDSLPDASPENVMSYVERMANLTPQDTVDGLSKSTLPRWFDSAEAQHVPGALKGQVTKLRGLYDQWKTFDGDRATFNKIAEGLGVDPYLLAKELYNADIDGANVRYRQFIDDIAVKAADENGLDPAEFQKQLDNAKTPEEIASIVPDGNAGSLLKAILTDTTTKALTGKSLKVLASKFVGDNPAGIGLTNDLFKVRMLAAIESGIGSWSAKYFGVKPSNKFMRLSQLAKRAQGYALLGWNPANFVNNTLNNWATIGADMGIGALLGTTDAVRKQFHDETGIVSSRLAEGGLYSEMGLERSIPEIGQALRADDGLQKVQDFVGKGQKYTPFSKLSQKAERVARDIAFTASAREYLDKFWTPGKGFEKITPDLRMVLDIVEPGLADKIEKAVARGKNVTDIEKQVFGNLDRKSMRDVLSVDEVDTLRKFNAEGFDALEKAIDDGKPMQVALSDYRKATVDGIRKRAESETYQTVANSMLKLSAEGITGMADEAGNIFADYADFHNTHMNNMAETALEAQSAPDSQTASAIWREAFRNADEEWSDYWTRHDKQWLGYLRGIGEMDPEQAGSLKTIYDMRLNQREFFAARRDLYETHALTKFDTIEESQADWARTQTELNQKYIDMTVEESRLQSQFDDHVKNVFVERGLQGINDKVRRQNLEAEVTLWLGRRLEVRRKMMEQELLFRTGEVPLNVLDEFGDLITPEVKKQILDLRNAGDKDTYYREVYQRGIVEMLDTTNRNAPGRDVMTPEKVAEAKPYQERASIEKQRGELRKIAHDVANINNDVYLMNVIKKYADPNLQSMNDVSPDILLKALTNREIAHNAPLDSMDRTAFARGLQATYNLTDEQLKSVMVFQDAIAKYFAEEKGVTPDDIFKAGFAEISKGMGGIEQTGKGSVDFLSDGRAVLKGMEAADISTAIHETGHVWLRSAPDADKSVITKWLRDEYGKELADDWMMQDYVGNADLVDAHEKFSRAMERYFTEGIAPLKATKRLLAAFDRVKEWMTQIYREITGSQIDVRINADLKALFDTWITGKRVEPDPVKAVGERAVEMVDPKTPEYVTGVSTVDTKPATPEVKADVQELKTRAKGDYSARLPRNFNEYPPAIQQAMQDWIDHKIYIQKGNLRYSSKYDWDDNRGGRIVSYNKEVKSSFPDLNAFTDILHSGTELLQQVDWTPETLNNYINLLIKVNDPVKLMEAVRDEPIGNRAKFLDAVGRQAPELASPVWRAMDRTGELYSDRISGQTRSLLQEMPVPEKLPEGSVPLGTVDSLSDMSTSQGMMDMYLNSIKPMLNKLEVGLRGSQDTPRKALDVSLDPKVMEGVRQYVRKIQRQRADVNMAALRHGESKADFAMLNYGRQTNLDNLANVVFPYQFWYTRSMFNWGVRAIDKPKIYADYFRLMNFTNAQSQDKEGSPYRLKGKIRLPIPFLPDWMGDVYIDPYKQIFPFVNIARPWAEFATEQNRENKKAQTILQDMADNGEINQQEVDTAINTMQGDTWKKALAQARYELESDTSDPLDFAQTISSVSLPLSIARNMATGRQDKMGMLPPTKLLKSLTAVMGINNYKGVDLSIKGMGGDTYEDYRINSMLANMAAMGEITADQAKEAMVSQAGDAYVEASRKVSILNMTKQALPGIGLDFYPQGEQKLRAENELYKKNAIQAFESGDTKAKSTFFDKNPELSARYQSYETDPDKMLTKYLEGQVWDTYNDLPDLYKKQVREQLGNVFTDWTNPETRATMSDATYAGWIQAMGKSLPKELGLGPAAYKVKLSDQASADAVQKFYDAKKKVFPWSETFWNEYYAQPENSPVRTQMKASKQYQQMSAWENAYKANNPAIIPFVIDEKDALYGADQKTAANVYAYRAEKAGRFPWLGKWDTATDQQKDTYYKWQNKYLAKHPEVVPYAVGESNDLAGVPAAVQSYVYKYRAAVDEKFPNYDYETSSRAEKNEYFAFQKQMAANYPEAAPYILSDNTIRRSLGQPTLPYVQVSMDSMSNPLRNQYQDYLYSGMPLTAGARIEMTRLWKEAGEPLGDFETYLESLR